MSALSRCYPSSACACAPTLGVCVRALGSYLRPRGPLTLPRRPPPSLFSPFFRLSSRRPTTQPAPVPPLILICAPLSRVQAFFSSSDAEPVKWIPTVRGQKLYPITTAFIFMTQEAAGELGLCLSRSLSLSPCLSFKLGNLTCSVIISYTIEPASVFKTPRNRI